MKEVEISQVKTNPKNPRVIADSKFILLKKSLKEFPDMLNKRPLVCVTDTDGKFVVLGGNMRLKAANEIGLKKIPIILADEWTEEQKAEFLIKDNASFGQWNWEELKSEWDEGLLQDWGLDLPSNWEEPENLEAEEDDFDETPPENPITVLGDLYEIGEHRLLCGDSTDSDQVEKLMNGEKADMVHTDPPYNIDYEGGSKKRDKIANDKLDDFPQFLYDVYTTLTTALKKGGAIYVWHASSETHNFIQQFLNAGFLFKSYIVWNKNNSTFGRSDYHWKHEP